MKARERNKLLGLIRREGMTLVPLVLYFNDRGVAKIQIGLAKGRAGQAPGGEGSRLGREGHLLRNRG